MQIALGRPDLATLSALARRAAQWWLAELLHLLPDRLVVLLTGGDRPSLVIAPERSGIRLELLVGGAPFASHDVQPAADLMAEVDRFLASQELARKGVDIGLRLPAEQIFCRRLLLPAEAADAVGAIAAQDLATKTPFKAEDIYSDHLAVDEADRRLAVWQWVIRRSFVEQAVATLGVDLADIAFLSAPSAEGQPAPYISLRRQQEARQGWTRRAALMLCGSAVVLALLGGGLRYWNQQAALDRLDAQIAASGKRAQQVRALADQLQEKKTALLRLRLKRNEAPGLIDLWDELSRVLPANSYLTEFRLAETSGKREEQLTIQGFSASAANLVGIVDASPLLFDAALTSPIAYDATEGRERFALQAKVRAPGSIREASR